MPHPKDDPVAFCQQAWLNPDDRTLPANRESVSALDNEIARLAARMERLREARDLIRERMKAA